MIPPFVSVVIPTYNRKEKLERLLNSILQSDYPKEKIEIIVVDDASNDGTAELIAKQFNTVLYIRNIEEKLVAAARNRGLKASNGEFILIIDDDNIIYKDTIIHLVRVLTDDKSIGIAAPIMYYDNVPNKIWCAGIKRNMVTSKTTFIGLDQIDEGQFDTILDSDDFPNCFMTRKEIIDIGIFFDDVNFPIHFEESDFCERIKRRGYRSVLVPSAKVFHDTKIRGKGFETELRTYYTARNRIIFHKKYSKLWQFLIFILVSNSIVTLYYLKEILVGTNVTFNEKIKITKAYLKGVFKGICEVSQKSKC